MLKLTGTDPLAPGAWTKYPNPVFQSSEENEVYGPGHASFTKSPDGTEDWIIYHANKRDGVRWSRSTRAQKFTWVKDEPVFGDPVSLDEPQALPSGELVDRILVNAEDMALDQGCVIKERFGAKTVEFKTLDNVAEAVVNVEQAGNYALSIRYRNTSGVGTDVFLKLNNSKVYPCTVGISGRACTSVEIGLPLEAGKNQISFSAAEGIQINCMILDRNPVVIKK
jgi:hypothetical protein